MKVFDFDNTIYDGESMVDFVYFMIDKKEKLKKYKGIVDKLAKLYEINLLSPSLIENVINKYKKDFDLSSNNITKYIDEFWESNKKKIRKEMLDKIDKEDLIITAAPDILIDPVRKLLKTKNIYSSIVNIEKRELVFMCYKENKAKKFKELYGDKQIDELYTDSYADKPLMKLSKKVYLIDKKAKEIKLIKGE